MKDLAEWNEVEKHFRKSKKNKRESWVRKKFVQKTKKKPVWLEGSKQRQGWLQVVEIGRNLSCAISRVIHTFPVASSWDMRMNFLPDAIYSNIHDALLFQMALEKRLQEPYVSKSLMSMIIALSLLLKVKPSVLPLHRSLSLRETLIIILMGLPLPSVLLISHQGQLTYGISNQ